MRFILNIYEFWLHRASILSLSATKCRGVPFIILQNHRFKNTISLSKTLKDFGIKKEEIYSCTELLSEEELREKTEILIGEVTNKDEFLCLIKLPIKDIEKYLEIKNKDEKIQSLSCILKCSHSEALNYFAKHTFLLRSKISTIKAKADMLLNSGISLEDLKRDLWVLMYTKKFMQSRLESIKKINISPIRPWMLRCQLNILLRAKNNKDENLQAMAPYTSSKQYVSERLQISPSEFDSIVKKYPPFASVQVLKLKEVLDFLLHEGFTSKQICRTPRVFCHSIETIKDRLAELKENNYYPSSISILCKNKNDFNAFVSRLKKNTYKES